MFSVSILFLLFSSLVITQYFRIQQLVVFERKTTGMYLIMIFGVIIILGVAFCYGNTLFHALTGLLGALVLIGSQYITGLTSDSFIHTSPPRIRRYIGQQISFKDSKNIRLENFHENKIVIRFIAYKSERFLTFSKEDESKIKNILDYNFTTVN